MSIDINIIDIMESAGINDDDDVNEESMIMNLVIVLNPAHFFLLMHPLFDFCILGFFGLSIIMLNNSRLD